MLFSPPGEEGGGAKLLSSLPFPHHENDPIRSRPDLLTYMPNDTGTAQTCRLHIVCGRWPASTTGSLKPHTPCKFPGILVFSLSHDHPLLKDRRRWPGEAAVLPACSVFLKRTIRGPRSQPCHGAGLMGRGALHVPAILHRRKGSGLFKVGDVSFLQSSCLY